MGDVDSPLEILVVDDQTDILELLGEYLRARGHGVTALTDGDLAVAELRSRPVDVLLTDVNMERMGGLDLIDAARSLPVPVGVVVMTGFASVDSAVRAMRAGAHDYLLKPFRLREVHAALAAAAHAARDEAAVRRQLGALALLDRALSGPVELAELAGEALMQFAAPGRCELVGGGGTVLLANSGAGAGELPMGEVPVSGGRRLRVSVQGADTEELRRFAAALAAAVRG